MTISQYFVTNSVKNRVTNILYFYNRYHACGIDRTANMALDLFWFLCKIYCLFRLKYKGNNFRIGIKDKFSCFMMVLNY